MLQPAAPALLRWTGMHRGMTAAEAQCTMAAWHLGPGVETQASAPATSVQPLCGTHPIGKIGQV